jgi:hypothetical protein
MIVRFVLSHVQIRQSLALNDARCRPEMRFEVLARESLNAQVPFLFSILLIL